MAKLTIETIPPIPVEPEKRYILELTKDEMYTLYAITGKSVDNEQLASIYYALRSECGDIVRSSEYTIKMRDWGNAYFFGRDPESRN